MSHISTKSYSGAHCCGAIRRQAVAALMRRAPGRACTAVNEYLGAVRVIVEHVEAGAGRRQQHDITRLRRRQKPARTASSMLSARSTGTPAPASAAAISAPSRPISTTARACCATAGFSGLKSWPLPSPPAISTTGCACRSARPRSRRHWCPWNRRKRRRRRSSATHSTRCGRPLEWRSASAAAAIGRPTARHKRERRERVGGVVQTGQRQSRKRHQRVLAFAQLPSLDQPNSAALRAHPDQRSTTARPGSAIAMLRASSRFSTCTPSPSKMRALAAA